MDKSQYIQLKEKLISAGYQKEIEWAENIKPCEDAESFFCEYSWVVLNSGMKEQIARIIWERILQAIKKGDRISSAFRHKQKAAAIQAMKENREHCFKTYQEAPDKLIFLRTLKFIGKITISPGL